MTETIDGTFVSVDSVEKNTQLLLDERQALPIGRYKWRLLGERSLNIEKYFQFLKHVGEISDLSGASFEDKYWEICQSFAKQGETIDDENYTFLRIVEAPSFLDFAATRVPSLGVFNNDNWDTESTERALEFLYLNEDQHALFRSQLSLAGGPTVFAAVIHDEEALVNELVEYNSTHFRDALGLTGEGVAMIAFAYRLKESSTIRRPTAADAGTHPFFVPSHDNEEFGSTINLKTLIRGPIRFDSDSGFHEIVHENFVLNDVVSLKMYCMKETASTLVWTYPLPLPLSYEDAE